MKRTTSDLRAIIPAMTEWAVKPGDALRVFSPEGDPRDSTTDLNQAYIVPDPFVLQPSYFTRFIATDPFSSEEIASFTLTIGQEISDEFIAQAHRAIDEFVCTLALEHRLATWKEIEDQLRLILTTCRTIIRSSEQLIKLTNENVVDDSVARGALSADQLVKKMLMDKRDASALALKVELDGIVKPCIQSLAEVKAKTKRGRKRDDVFRLFLSRLANAMKAEGLEIKVPSNDNVFDKFDPTFLLVMTLLETCFEKGKIAISKSELENPEKIKATKSLSHYRKSPRALVHYFRDGSLS